MTLNGIDVSQWQAADLSNVPYDFLIARATWGDGITANGFVDPWADRHIQTAIRRGKLFGFYHFMTTHDPVQQARWFVQNCKNYFGHGIPVLDYEDIGNGVERAASTHGDAGALKFLNEVYRLTGVRPLVYANSSHAAGLHQVAKANYGLWVANWGANAAGGYRTPHAVGSGPFPFVAIHQYTSRGRLDGYGGDLDLDIAYLTAAQWAKYAGSSGEPAPAPTPGKKTNEQLAAEVWAGVWGDGQDRIDRLTKAGYDAAAVQAIVNKTAPSSPTRHYTVKPGDNLSSIAAKYGIEWRAIYNANRSVLGDDPNVIYAGTVLTIP